MAVSEGPVYLGWSRGLNKCQGKEMGRSLCIPLGLPREPALVPWAPIAPRNTSVLLWPLFMYLMLLKHLANFN